MYFRIKAKTANAITSEPKVGSAVARVNLNGEKLRNSPTRAVMAKLNPMENAALSIISICSSRGNMVCVRQYPGRTATRMNAKTYRMYDSGVPVSGMKTIEMNDKTAEQMTIQNHVLFFGDTKLLKFSCVSVFASSVAVLSCF